MYFFTLAESGAVKLSELANDPAWTVNDRLSFAARALRAVEELHAPAGANGETVIHRNLTPDTIRVRADGAPLFAGWRWARLPFAQTIAPGPMHEVYDEFTAPEVRAQGLTAALAASDVYSLCKSLLTVAIGGGGAADTLRSALTLGLDEDPFRRGAPTEIAELIEESWTSTNELATAATAPAAKRWDEGYTFDWENHRYRVVSLLGHGGAGRTFKLEELDRDTTDPIGTYVGKVVLNAELGPASLQAYRKIRSIADHPCLASVLHTSAEWSADTLIALLRWRRGEPLDAWKGEELSVLAEYVGESDVETMILRWAAELCEALEVIHAQGWVHGDVSPSNILVDESDVLLIDYDLAGPAGSVAATPGTFLYASPERRRNAPMRPADDVFALAASFFHIATGRQPFAGSGQPTVLPWVDSERRRWPRLVQFLDAATHPEASRRFESGGAAARMLRADATDTVSERSTISEPEPLTPNIVSRVRDILQAYPGSRFGNIETRGLDSKFAHDTYVYT
jgi:hypothetical protein